MSKRTVLGILVVAVIAIVIAVWRRSAEAPSAGRAASGAMAKPVSPGHAATEPAAGSPRSGAPGSAGPPGEIRRLSRDERRQLGAQIAAARQRAREAAASSGSGSGSPDDDVVPVEEAGKPLRDAMTAAIPLLAECYRQPSSDAMREAVALMTMTSDPELGTVIDTNAITDAAGKPLARALDDCLRDTIDSLALPPLARGGKMNVQYSFKFD
jgi:hypothetical protein